MSQQVYRLRLPTITTAWMYEVAETPEDASKQVEREFEGKFVFQGDGSEWEIELCPISELAQVCKDLRKLRREINGRKSDGRDKC